MKTTISILSITFGLLLLSINTQAQSDCSLPTAQASLDVNNVNARIKNAGDLWWDEGIARYIVPKVDPSSGLPEVAAIFAGGLWIGGIGPAGFLKLAAQTYGSNNQAGDYYAGPLNDDGTTDSDQCNNFDRIWETTSKDIDSHKLDFTDNGTIDGPVPASVLAWPGIGNPHFFDIHGFDLPDQPLAPFFDTNGNGAYDPNDGDYPEIHEADLGQWTVFNDAGNIHTQTGGRTLGVEVHLLAYAYSSSNDAINDATFYDYTIINKSPFDLDSVYAAIWVDTDLGCHTDDYVGCSPQKNLAFVYNMDAVDGETETDCSCVGAVNTYCEEIPVVGLKILNGVYGGRIFGLDGTLENPSIGQNPDTIVNIGMSSFQYFQNEAIFPGPLPVLTGPQLPKEYYNLMSASWKNGLPLTTGGNGYNPGSTDYTRYAFSGNPANASEWSMCSVGAPAGDPRMVISSGPFSMQTGEVNHLSFAVIYQANVAHPCPDISGLEEIADAVQTFYDETIITSTSSPVYNVAALSIVPNPFNNQAQLIFEGTDQLIKQVQLFSINGQLLRSYNNLRENNLTIEKGNLTPGMYIYKVLTKNQKVYTGKFVIQ